MYGINAMGSHLDRLMKKKDGRLEQYVMKLREESKKVINDRL